MLLSFAHLTQTMGNYIYIPRDPKAWPILKSTSNTQKNPTRQIYNPLEDLY